MKKEDLKRFIKNNWKAMAIVGAEAVSVFVLYKLTKSTLKSKTVSVANTPKFIELDIPESLKDVVHAIDTYEGSDFVNVWTSDNIALKDFDKFAKGLSDLEGFDPETSTISGVVTMYK